MDSFWKKRQEVSSGLKTMQWAKVNTSIPFVFVLGRLVIVTILVFAATNSMAWEANVTNILQHPKTRGQVFEL
jgi:hypothetical protein